MEIILLLILVALAGAGVYYLYFKDAPKKDSYQPRQVSASSIVNVRNAVVSGDRVFGIFDMDIEDYNNVMANPEFTIVTSDEDYYEENDLDRLRNPDVPEEEKLMIVESLRRNGYKVTYPYPPEDGQAEAPASEEESEQEAMPEDISAINDTRRLHEILQDPFVSEEDKALAKERLAQLGEDAGDGTGSDGNYVAPPYDDGGYGDEFGGYVDPDTFQSPEPPHTEETPEGTEPGNEGDAAPEVKPEVAEGVVKAPEAEHEEPGEQVEPAAEAQPQRSDGGKAGEWFGFDGDVDIDDSDFKIAVRLMNIIFEAFRENLLPPEFILYVAKRFSFKIDDNQWTPEQKLRAEQREVIYHRIPKYDSMSIEEFEQLVNQKITKAKDMGRPVQEEEAPAQEPEREGGEVAIPGKPVSVKVVSVFFDAHGGKNDLMWERLRK